MAMPYSRLCAIEVFNLVLSILFLKIVVPRYSLTPSILNTYETLFPCLECTL